MRPLPDARSASPVAALFVTSSVPFLLLLLILFARARSGDGRVRRALPSVASGRDSGVGTHARPAKHLWHGRRITVCCWGGGSEGEGKREASRCSREERNLRWGKGGRERTCPWLASEASDGVNQSNPRAECGALLSSWEWLGWLDAGSLLKPLLFLAFSHSFPWSIDSCLRAPDPDGWQDYLPARTRRGRGGGGLGDERGAAHVGDLCFPAPSLLPSVTFTEHCLKCAQKIRISVGLVGSDAVEPIETLMAKPAE